MVTVTAGVVEPRYPSFKGIMAAKSKPLDQLTVADLGLDAGQVGAAGARQEVLDVSAAAGVPVETLRKIETGRIVTPAFFTVAALAQALELDLRALS